MYALVFPGRSEHESVFVQPDWERVHRELARVGVTLKLLHGEYLDGCTALGQPATLTDPADVSCRVLLFVACLPFSRYAFVEPTLDMRQESWFRAHVAMFDWFGGTVPRIVLDNLKTRVISHPREGEVVLNDAYRELAAHYSAAVLPGRVRRPKDKASVENTVGHVATWVIAGLRDREFTTLPELRAAVQERVEAYTGSRSRSHRAPG